MTLQRIRIENFQCHEDLRIKLDPQITAIVGPSDVGKSAILRALRWVATNRPLGDGFTRQGTKQSAVTVWSDQGRVKRIRGKDENSYTADGEVLEAFGADVPAQVRSLLRIDEVNFQGQHEAPFWFSLSAGEVAKQLNEIVDLTMIDRVMENIARKVRGTKASLEVLEKRVEKLMEDLASCDYVEQLDDDLENVERLQTSWQKKKDRHDSITPLVEKLIECDDFLAEADEQLVLGRRALDAGIKAKEAADRNSMLIKWLATIQCFQETASVEVPSMEELETLLQEAKESDARLRTLSKLVRNAGAMKSEWMRISKQAEIKVNELNKRCGGRCPICGNSYEVKQ